MRDLKRVDFHLNTKSVWGFTIHRRPNDGSVTVFEFCVNKNISFRGFNVVFVATMKNTPRDALNNVETRRRRTLPKFKHSNITDVTFLFKEIPTEKNKSSHFPGRALFRDFKEKNRLAQVPVQYILLHYQ